MIMMCNRKRFIIKSMAIEQWWESLMICICLRLCTEQAKLKVRGQSKLVWRPFRVKENNKLLTVSAKKFICENKANK